MKLLVLYQIAHADVLESCQLRQHRGGGGFASPWSARYEHIGSLAAT